jgi:DNA-binding protein HU-beta
MKRRDLTDLLANDHAVSKAEANRIVRSILDAIVAAVESGKTVKISGFGHFEARDRAARMAHNPRTGDARPIKARRALVFRPAKAVRDALNAN